MPTARTRRARQRSARHDPSRTPHAIRLLAHGVPAADRAGADDCRRLLGHAGHVRKAAVGYLDAADLPVAGADRIRAVGLCLAEDLLSRRDRGRAVDRFSGQRLEYRRGGPVCLRLDRCFRGLSDLRHARYGLVPAGHARLRRPRRGAMGADPGRAAGHRQHQRAAGLPDAGLRRRQRPELRDHRPVEG